MINKDLYPTPTEVIQHMLVGSNISNAKILDPSAGFGNILDYTKAYTNNLYAYEIEDRLQAVLKDKQYRLLGEDFLKSQREDISHITHIIMNPPFSADSEHILHAWEIAPEGCEIIALCNWQTIDNYYSSRRRSLKHIIQDYGTSQNLGSVFQNAERQTNVEIGLIKLYKPISSEDIDYSMFFTQEEEEEKQQVNGIMDFNEVRSIVNRYVGILKQFDIMQQSLNYINDNGKEIGMGGLSYEMSQNRSFTDKETFAKNLQKSSWRYIFNKLNMNKYLTTKMIEKVNKFVEDQQKVPFTMQNIFVMLDIIYQTRHESLQNALVEAVDNFTKHTHENRYEVPGWKTNLGHMLNKKIIIDYIATTNFGSSYQLNHGNRRNHLEDLIKVLCNITGTDFTTTKNIWQWLDKDWVTGQWYTVDFFEIKFFKKGTLHLKFKNIEHWKMLNEYYGKIKGFTLPEDFN